MMMPTTRIFITALFCLPAALIYKPSFAADPKELYAHGMSAYGKGDFVDALKYLFAYKIVMGSSLDSDPSGKTQMEEALIYCEKKVRGSTLYAASTAASSRKIGVKGVLTVPNPYLNMDGSLLEKSLLNTQDLQQTK